jgi:non-specific serine/threonine protein kinase/serine/threonine-protein kinase
LSDPSKHTKEPNSNKVDLQSDSPASPNFDADATLDAPGSAAAGFPQGNGSASTPKAIGDYRLVKKLGEGGMGQVWLAEQTAPVRRQVALKLIRAGMFDDALLQRFQSERQSLAIMDHPTIAKIFDAGTTTDGQPYFVMEYVPGLPITEYCDQKRLRVAERLELFIKVCEGVQHAHQKAIIHRDLKPANILVVDVDGKPVPRIIDFGLAKATTPQLAGETMFTQVGAFVGTPGYMSPEQTDSGAQDVDTRTDVYSLGVVLYVLLTGSLPLDTKQWKKQSLHEVLRHLREDDPPRPSAKIGIEKESSGANAESRGVQPKQLAGLLHGDLDWITMKALEKDRARRFGTPSELAGDITRYLRHEPVAARPASKGYRLQKYVRRHRVGVVAVAGLLLLLAGFAVAQEVQLRRIIEERDRTARERDRANRITEFMTSMFKVSDPGEARGNSVTAREILDKASKEIETGLARDPELQAQLMHLMGTVYDKLGLYPRAESLLRRAVDIRLQALGAQNPDSLRSADQLAWVLLQQGRYAEAEKLARDTVETQSRVLGPEKQATLDSMTTLASVYRLEGRLAESEELNRRTLDIERRVLGREHPDTLATMENLATVLDTEGRHAEAERAYRETLEIERRLKGPEHPDAVDLMNNVAVTLAEEGRYAESKEIFRETLEIRRRVLGPKHPKTAETLYNLGCVAAMSGDRDEALSLLREAIDHGLPPNYDLELNGDDDLKSLDGDPRFVALVAHAKERAALQKPN